MLIILIAAVIVLLDQLSKLIVMNSLTLNQSVPLIPNVLHITYIHNFGGAFGILAHRTGLFIFVAFVVVVMLLVFSRQIPREHKLLRLALAFQLGGAVGNLIDRVRWGYVIDFIDVRIWPVWNVADMAIIAGIGLLILDLVLSGREKGM
jgi:signal peptidase II